MMFYKVIKINFLFKQYQGNGIVSQLPTHPIQYVWLVHSTGHWALPTASGVTKKMMESNGGYMDGGEDSCDGWWMMMEGMTQGVLRNSEKLQTLKGNFMQSKKYMFKVEKKCLIHKQLEMHGYVLSIVATDALVLKNWVISFHRPDIHCIRPISEKNTYIVKNFKKQN